MGEPGAVGWVERSDRAEIALQGVKGKRLTYETTQKGFGVIRRIN